MNFILESNNISSQNKYILKRYLDALKMRVDVIANNIANADTPGFKRSDVTFESQLKRAIESRNYTGIKARVTDPRHIPFHRPIPLDSVKPKRVVDYATSMRNDGNNVDIDKEMTDLAKTNMLFQAVSDLLKLDYNLINLVLK